MKETVKINLGQRLFDLDVDAYEALKKYLDSLKRYFKKSPEEADEILQDIEQRMADILEEKMGGTKKSVTLEDIYDIISLMGTAEDFDSDIENEQKDSTQKNDEKEAFSGAYDKNYRKLYRDIDNNILGGVCKGIAAYFNIDPIWIRLLWVLLFCLKGIGLLAYLIMWIVVPAARTTAQKLEMTGRPVNVENIEQSVKNEFRKVKKNFNNFQDSDAFYRAKSAFGEIFSVVGRIVIVFLKVLLVMMGVIMASLGVALIFGIISISSFGLHHINFPDVPLYYYFHPYLQDSLLFIFAATIVLLIPVIAIFIGLIKVVFNVHTRHHVLSGIAWIIWILALIFIIFSMHSFGKFHSDIQKTTDEDQLKVNPEKILYISFSDEKRSKNNQQLFNFFGKELMHNNDEKKFYLHPKINIEVSDDSGYYLKTERNLSIPLSDKEFDLHNLDYGWAVKDSILILDTYFNVDDKEIWELPGLELTIQVPEGKKIKIYRDKTDPLSSQNINSGKFSHEYYNKVLIMKNGELQAVSNSKKD